MSVNDTIGLGVKLFFLLTPFFVLAIFVGLTKNLSCTARRGLAIRTTLVVLFFCMILYWFGEQIFTYLGITVDAFRVGAGLLLLISGIEVVLGKGAILRSRSIDEDGDVSVVPLAIPYTVGPGTVGALLVMGAAAENTGGRFIEMLCIVAAVFCFGVLLYFSDFLAKVLKNKGLIILSKLTGLFLAALAAQIIFEGIANLLHLK